MGQTETACEGGVRKRRAVKAGGEEERRGGFVVEECEVKRVARGLKRAETMGSLPGMKYVGIDLFKA